jgi:hypothetical protein
MKPLTEHQILFFKNALIELEWEHGSADPFVVEFRAILKELGVLK